MNSMESVFVAPLTLRRSNSPSVTIAVVLDSLAPSLAPLVLEPIHRDGNRAPPTQ